MLIPGDPAIPLRLRGPESDIAGVSCNLSDEETCNDPLDLIIAVGDILPSPNGSVIDAYGSSSPLLSRRSLTRNLALSTADRCDRLYCCALYCKYGIKLVHWWRTAKMVVSARLVEN
jgi:hypothetical protein